MTSGPIYVTRPIVPSMAELDEVLRTPLQSRRLTNNGPMVGYLELRLAEMLQVPHVALVSSGTIAIEVAAKALDLKGKVITTPFTFPATIGALLWIGLEPVLVDVEEDYLTIDPAAIEGAISDEISGIVGVHTYGNPCDVEAIDAIARRHELAVLYDGAHAFDGMIDDKPIVAAGDATTLSFHATKLFNSAEGGAVVSQRSDVHRRVELMRNFGIESDDRVVEVGINAKMSEIHASLGIANLAYLPEEKSHRLRLSERYAAVFRRHPAIRPVPFRPGTSPAPQYFPIRLSSSRRGSLRDHVHARLRSRGIYARRYFFPLLSDVPVYRERLKQVSLDFPRAAAAAREVLALPLHGGVGDAEAALIERTVLEAVDE